MRGYLFVAASRHHGGNANRNEEDRSALAFLHKESDRKCASHGHLSGWEEWLPPALGFSVKKPQEKNGGKTPFPT